MNLYFVKINEKTGDREYLRMWGDIPLDDVLSVAENFMGGFICSLDRFCKADFRYPCVMSKDGYIVWFNVGLTYQMEIECSDGSTRMLNRSVVQKFKDGILE